MNDTLVIIPTYDEKDNLDWIVGRTLDSGAAVDVLVVDDGSPDGTGDLADAYAARDPRVHVLHRTEKAGLGAAYLAGFAWGLERGYEALVEMDADGSHHPEYLPGMLALLGENDLVLGSRWVPGGRVENWPLRRELLSRGGSWYTRG
jgi:dolichol-phosphate mannosyltransferase